MYTKRLFWIAVSVVIVSCAGPRAVGAQLLTPPPATDTLLQQEAWTTRSFVQGELQITQRVDAAGVLRFERRQYLLPPLRFEESQFDSQGRLTERHSYAPQSAIHETVVYPQAAEAISYIAEYYENAQQMRYYTTRINGHIVSERVYDAQGRLREETINHWLPHPQDPSAILESSTQRFWDEWGNPCDAQGNPIVS